MVLNAGLINNANADNGCAATTARTADVDHSRSRANVAQADASAFTTVRVPFTARKRGSELQVNVRRAWLILSLGGDRATMFGSGSRLQRAAEARRWQPQVNFSRFLWFF